MNEHAVCIASTVGSKCDKTGATNIGSNGVRLLHNQPPIRAMSAEELEFHRLTVCVVCE